MQSDEFIAMSCTIDRARILVLGDSGVGKTSLVHLIGHGKPLSQISYTVGAEVEVKLHEYREGTAAQKTYWIELWDVGGSHSHRNSRHVFYNNFHGIILVHDLANRKSQQNLEKWLQEVTEREYGNGKQRSDGLWDDNAPRVEVIPDVNLPLLVIGTKQDLADDRDSLPRHQRRSYIAEEYGTEEIHLKCTDEKSLMPGSSASNKLSRFFDKVIEKQFYKRDKSGSFGSTPGQERRRLV